MFEGGFVYGRRLVNNIVVASVFDLKPFYMMKIRKGKCQHGLRCQRKSGVINCIKIGTCSFFVIHF